MARRYFEDLALGETWTSGEYEITEAEIIDYARKYDPQPMHVDPEAAAKGPHGSVIASGWMVAALSFKLFIEAGGYGDTPVMGLGNDELRWTQVVRPGDRLRSRREVVELRRSRSNPKNGIIRTRITVTSQDGDTVLSMLATGMIAARSAG
jgi:acyl dehydratase